MDIEEEVDRREPLLHTLSKVNALRIIEGVLDFLDLDEMTAMGELALRCGGRNKLFEVALAKSFMGKYLNRVDRSVFFVFYEDVDFHKIEKRTSHLLASSKPSLFAHHYLSYQNIFQAFNINSQFLEGQDDFLAIL